MEERELSDLFHSAMNISPIEPNHKPVLSLHKDSKEVSTINLLNGNTFEQKTILFALSECILGNLGTISRYIKNSADAELFLHGKDEDGSTTLIMAAAEENHEMVSLLLQSGAHVNAANNDGRSALMEAALWGRVKSVEALLKANADKCLRDKQGRCAMDLAQPRSANVEERYRRSPRAAADRLPERDRDRRHIIILLGDSNTQMSYAYTVPLSSYRNDHWFTKSEAERAITLHGPIQRYSVPRISKTAAILDRGEQFARISATSGWGVDALPPNYENEPSWVDKVYGIASTVGHMLQDAPDTSWDQGTPGRFHASHAEKKLIAYFIDKHIFMPQDRNPDQTLEDSILEVEASLKEAERSSITWPMCVIWKSRKEN
ncbi:uncharacterized protein PG986_014343 [Apiospora aurea]|uniref:Single-strand DNA deaminase toxin A-like C-terminal domain-containing protein n=1 Tax=Apiospora aurea TaxID=335848 RepID=A0ABR1PSQ2_9PEZI